MPAAESEPPPTPAEASAPPGAAASDPAPFDAEADPAASEPAVESKPARKKAKPSAPPETSPAIDGGDPNEAKMTLQTAMTLPAAARPPADWNGVAGSYVIHDFDCRIGVWIRKRVFYVYDRKPVPAGLKKNNMDNLQIGWKQSVTEAWDYAIRATSDE